MNGVDVILIMTNGIMNFHMMDKGKLCWRDMSGENSFYMEGYDLGNDFVNGISKGNGSDFFKIYKIFIFRNKGNEGGAKNRKHLA